MWGICWALFATTCELWVLGSLVASPYVVVYICCLVVLSAAIPSLYSSSLNSDTKEGIPSTVASTGCFGFVGIVPRPLTSSWCATWFALTRHGGFVEVESLDSFLIVCHPLQMLWVIIISPRDDPLPFIPFLFFHCVDQLCSSLLCAFAKRVSWILSFVCFIHSGDTPQQTSYGEPVEQWANSNSPSLIHNAKLPKSLTVQCGRKDTTRISSLYLQRFRIWVRSRFWIPSRAHIIALYVNIYKIHIWVR